jgi:predicted Zn finger-like uncharacterized protein
MKFHCDRCKTRYSIADDRVRGKILKIRCKNCSSVITLKEGAASASPRTPRQPTSDGRDGVSTSARRAGGRRATSTSGSALQGAFEEALRQPGSGVHSLSLAEPPPRLEAEWYVSLDGEQFGPFSLLRAQDWVAGRQPDDDLYCWSEGFDDWLPVEKVSHYRGLRGPIDGARAASGAFAMPRDGRALSQHDYAAGHDSGQPPLPVRDETPVPLFAATLAQVVADSQADRSGVGQNSGRRNGSSLSPLGLPSSRPPTGPGQSGGSLFASALAAATSAPGRAHGETADDVAPDLEIGEASRVVKLPMLARNAGNAAPLGAPGLPGVGGANNGLGRGTGSHGQPGSPLAGLPVIQAGPAIDVPRPEILQPQLRRRPGMMMPIAIGLAVVAALVSLLLYVALAGGDDDSLLRRGDVGGKGGLAYRLDDPEGAKKAAADKAAERSSSRPRRVAHKSSPSRSSGDSTAFTPPSSAGAGAGMDEVDLSGRGEAAHALDADDVFEVLNANHIGVQMCFNSALKRDPLIKVRRADVSIQVSPSGEVSSVSIPALSGTQLGLCLEKRIRAWKFPKATEVFNSRFPIVFQSS